MSIVFLPSEVPNHYPKHLLSLTEDSIVVVFVVQSLSHVWLFETPWTAARPASRPSPSPGVCPSSCPLVMPSSHIILCRPLFLLPSVFPSIRDFSNELAVHIRWPKYCSFSFSISPSNEYSWLISLQINWFDLLAVQVTFRSLLQHHISKVSNLCRSAFFMLQLSQPYMTTGKIIALTMRTFVSRVMSLLSTHWLGLS